MGRIKGHGKENMSENPSSRSWFCVFNNPSKLFGDIEPKEMVNRAIDIWCKDKPQRTCAVNYEIGDSGTPHMHMVLEDPSKVRFTAIQKLFPTAHIEPTRGNKKQAEDYILKRGNFAEKNHTVVIPAVFHGEINACQGSRNDLSVIEDLIEQGKSPEEIMEISISYRRHKQLIKDCFMRKKYRETPYIRDVTVYWHVGESGSGKSYTAKELIDRCGESKVYVLNDYSTGGFDMYEAQPVLFMDEFKGNISFQLLLNILDKYKSQIHCRYANAYMLWTEVHITSIFPPEEAYKFMVEEENQNRDKIQQLLRRLTYIVYHYKENDKFLSYTMDASQYTDYEALKQLANKMQYGFHSVDCAIPFD